MRKLFSAFAVVVAFGASGCTNTAIQGYADRNLPSKGIQHIAAYVAAATPLASSMEASIVEEARKRGILAEDALTILPPTRTYTDAEVRKALAERGVDGVLVIAVADSGVISQYAGTVFSASYSGGATSGTAYGSAAPTYRYARKTDFTARLVEPASGRNLWVGNGEVSTEGGKGLLGRLTVTDGVNTSYAINAVFDDLQKKGLIGGSTS
jgi:hypothetical protein